MKLVILASTGLSSPAVGQDRAEGLGLWRFLVGKWNVVEQRFDFDDNLIQTNDGRATFSFVMAGQRIEEIQTFAHDGDTTHALHLFVYNPETQTVEIARTDSGHFDFWILTGTLDGSQINLVERDPDLDSQVTRRITYMKVDDDHFSRVLEFSTDGGGRYFKRSIWEYSRAAE